MIKLAVVEDNPHWLRVMNTIISSNKNFELVGSASSRTEAIDLAITKDIDLMLINTNINGKKSDGIFCTLDILQKKKLKIIMISSNKERDVIVDSFTAGAVDFILKENLYELPYIVRRAYNRSSISEVLLDEFRRLKREDQLRDFSPAELEIFTYIEKGYNKSQIEGVTYKTKNTIKQQIRSIFKKLNVKSRQEAIKKIHSNGLLESSSDI